MATLTGEPKFSKAWLVLAVILVLFVVTILVDGLVQTLVPSYVGIFHVGQSDRGEMLKK